MELVGCFADMGCYVGQYPEHDIVVVRSGMEEYLVFFMSQASLYLSDDTFLNRRHCVLVK